MILRKHDKFVGGDFTGAIAMASLSVFGELPGINVAFTERLHQVFHPAKVLVATSALAGEKSVYGVMKVVIPLRIQTVAVRFSRQQEAAVIQITFPDHINLASSPFRVELLHSAG